MNEFLDYIKDYRDALDLIVKAVTSLVALIGLFWTLFSGLKTFRNYSKNKKDEQISALISSFSDESEIKRLSSANRLVGYCDSLFKELFLLCLVEQNFYIHSKSNSDKKILSEFLVFIVVFGLGEKPEAKLQ